MSLTFSLEQLSLHIANVQQGPLLGGAPLEGWPGRFGWPMVELHCKKQRAVLAHSDDRADLGA